MNIFLLQLLKRFDLPATTSLQARYVDSDGDPINISSDSELKEALICALHQSSSALRLELSISERLTTPSSPVIPTRTNDTPLAAAAPQEVMMIPFCVQRKNKKRKKKDNTSSLFFFFFVDRRLLPRPL